MDRLESFELLCQYVTPVDVEVHQPGNEAIFENHDWETILKLADEYLVTPSLYLGLQRRGLLKHLDKDLRNHLAAIYLLNKDRNAKIKAQALATIELLNSEDVQPVLLKGVAGLLTGLYEDEGERYIGDIDLMVDKSKLIQVVELLTAHEHRCDTDIQNAVLSHSFHRHELSLIPNANSVKIDLHVRPAASSGSMAFVSSENARNQANPFVIGAAAAFLPSPTFRLMHNFFHAQSLDRCYLDGHINLRQLLDWVRLWQMVRGVTVSYAEISDKLNRYRLNHSFILYVLTAERLLKQPISAGVGVSRFVELLFSRQRLCLKYLWFYRLNALVVFFLRGVFLFTPGRIRLIYGDMSTLQLLNWVAKDFLDPAWYVRRFYEVKGHVIRFIY